MLAFADCAIAEYRNLPRQWWMLPLLHTRTTLDMLRTQRTTPLLEHRLPHAGVAVALVAGLLAVPTDAPAQPPRLFVDVNGGTQVSTTDFADNVVFTEFIEEGDLNATYAVDTGLIIDVSGGIMLGKGLAVGGGFTRFDRSHDARVDARVPHPFFFDRSRSISGAALDLTRQEHAVHVQLRWFAPVPGPVQFALFGGPSFFFVDQDLVTAVTFTHSFPFDTASFSSAATRSYSESATGYHVGADAAVFFSRYLGIGGLVRFSRASVDFTSEDGGQFATDVGGLHLGGGLRMRF